MKSSEHRDQIAEQHSVIAFEIEGAGIWDEVPCVIAKGISHYADSHENKAWQPFGAATAAAVAKAMLGRYTLTDNPNRAARITGEPVQPSSRLEYFLQWFCPMRERSEVHREENV
jgi:hypothetical protein